MEKESILELGNMITQRVLRLSHTAESDNNPLLVKAQDLKDYYKYNYNPQKGETPEGELNRWLKFVREKGILWAYQYEADSYIFVNEIAHRVKINLQNEGLILT